MMMSGTSCKGRCGVRLGCNRRRRRTWEARRSGEEVSRSSRALVVSLSSKNRSGLIKGSQLQVCMRGSSSTVYSCRCMRASIGDIHHQGSVSCPSPSPASSFSSWNTSDHYRRRMKTPRCGILCKRAIDDAELEKENNAYSLIRNKKVKKKETRSLFASTAMAAFLFGSGNSSFQLDTSGIESVLSSVSILTIIVVIHELGHFAAARVQNIKVIHVL